MTEQKVFYRSPDPTISFAASELAGYLSIQTELSWSIEPVSGFQEASHGIWIGLAKETPLTIPKVDDPMLDDAIMAEIDSGTGIISGSNPRSVLLGVYRVLYENGCRWIRPGSDGEIIPLRSLRDFSCSISERPSYRHRGICIEGAVSFEHVRDMIDWLPKVGMNAYFFQFRESFIFFERWYSHRDNPLLESESFSVDDARKMMNLLVEEVTLRDLVYHAVGHGWTCEPFGIEGLGWDTYDGVVPPDAIASFAEINGKKELFHGIPLDTNLCYSKKWVRDRMIDAIIQYLESHVEIDLLHLWLADGRNNHCECKECSLSLPADLYIKLLNELDEKLTSIGISVRIVFLVYEDLYWPAKEERIENPARFILMFAPITRTYSQHFSSDMKVPSMSKYIRNKLDIPVTIEENLSYLRGWQEQFSGDSFDYDYHLIWDHYTDPGYMDVSRGLACDIRALSDIGLNGYISCQVQRSFFPTGLAMYMLGRSLWDRNIDDEQLIKDYFEASFGSDWVAVRNYLEEITTLFDPVYIRGEKKGFESKAVSSLSRVPEVLDNFAGEIENRVSASSHSAQKRSWRILQYHAIFCRSFSNYLISEAKGDREKSEEDLENLKKTIWEMEPEVQEVFDGWMFLNSLKRRAPWDSEV